MANPATGASGFSTGVFITDIEAFGHRLLICPNKLTTKIFQNTADAYLESQRNKYGSIIEQARSDYNKIRSLYKKCNSTLLISLKESNECPEYHLTEHLLQKIIKKANVVLSRSYHPSGAEIFILKDMPSIFFGCMRKKNTLFIFTFTKLAVSQEDPNFLGRGNYITVQKTYCISSAALAALKISICPEGNIMIQKDIKILKHIYSNREFRNILSLKESGIQEFPLLKTTITVKNLNNNNFLTIDLIITKYCNGGNLITALKTWFKPDQVNKLQLLYSAIRLIKAVKVLHDSGIIHGDIKPDNLLLIYRLINGEKVFKSIKLSDFGGSKNLSEEPLIDPQNCFSTLCSVGYFTKFDHETALIFASDYINCTTSYKKEELRQRWIDLNKKRDLFGLATSLWVLFYNQMPCDIGEKYANPEIIYKPLKDIMGEEIKYILVDALSENSLERPSPERMLQVFEREVETLKNLCE